ncbi:MULTISPECIES: argininosuccinate lyase [Shouchella]|nr:argininosuccinate lyase [Shouchella clausii]
MISLVGRLKESPSQEMIDLLFKPSIRSDLKHHYSYLLKINSVHLFMLKSEGIISDEAASKIHSVLTHLQVTGKEALSINPALEDLYFNVEAYIIEQTGPEIGGQMHTGRSRNDILATVTRMRIREEMIEIYELVCTLRRTLIDLATEHTSTLMTGYTHLQPAEPITFAHYLSALLHGFERDFTRLYNCYAHINKSPLGSCALASTTFSINRKFTMELLGFADLLENSLDGIASRDYALEALSALSIFSNSLSRFAQDLYTWCSYEFGYLEVGHSVAVISSIMPQKKNPVTLEHIKAKAGHIQGALVSSLSVLKNTLYSHSRDTSMESMKYTWEAINETKAAIRLMIKTLQTLTVHKDNMAATTRQNFSTVTELANALVRHYHFSFRTAHHIVAEIVNETLNQGLGSDKIEASTVERAIKQVTAKTVSVTKEFVEQALDPERNISLRTVRGGSAPVEVARQLQQLEQTLASDHQKISDLKQALQSADQLYKRYAAELERGAQ